MIIVGFLVAYDYPLLQYSIPLVYAEANRIVLSVDAEWKTWSGRPFSIAKYFLDWLSEIDTDHKIVWEKGNYADINKNPLDNETQQRNDMFRNHPGYDWYIQLDADEYFIHFKQFVEYLNTIDDKQQVNVSVCLKTIYKQIANTFFQVGGKMETVGVATNHPSYTKGRFVEKCKEIKTSYVLLHQSWGRSENDVRHKLRNWGHRDDLNPEMFLQVWKRCNKFTYVLYRYFHPLHAPIWPYLEQVKAESISALIDHYRHHPLIEKPVPPLTWPQKLIKKLLKI
jgi:hypothetical protein